MPRACVSGSVTNAVRKASALAWVEKPKVQVAPAKATEGKRPSAVMSRWNSGKSEGT